MATTRHAHSGSGSASSGTRLNRTGTAAGARRDGGRLRRACVDALEDRRLFSTAYALLGEAGTTLIKFDTATPGTIQNAVTISGLQAGEAVAGIDFRPANGKLYALGIVDDAGANSSGRLYTVDTSTGAATLVGPGAFSNVLADQGTTVASSGYGFDFNPAVDRIRVTNGTDQNFRLNPNNGAVVDGDGGTAGVQFDSTLSDGNAGTAETLVGVAYDRNDNVPGTGTTLYALDLNGDNLATIGSIDGTPNSPNGGVVAEVGPLGLTATDGSISFDIAPDGTAYATISTNDPTLANPRLYTINLATGAATPVGFVGNGSDIITGLAIDVGDLPNAPVATSDSYTAVRNTPLVVAAPGVLANDTDDDGDALAASFLTGPTNGTLNLNPNGGFTYTPNAGYTGSDSFTYQASDGALLSAPATVTISVTPPDLLAVGLVGSSTLIKFNINTPGVILDTVFVSGLQPGEQLLGIDYRPANARLYGVGSTGRVYTIDANTGATTSVVLAADPADTVDGNPAFTTLSGTTFGVDFNPVPDRLRIHSDDEQNLRVNVDTGLVFTDAALNPGNPTVNGSAYTNPDANPATGTTLYAIDVSNETLKVVNPPNNGTLTTVGTNLTLNNIVGNANFDITQDGRAFLAASIIVSGSTQTYLGEVNLTTGSLFTANLVGNGAQPLNGLAITLEDKAPTAAANVYNVAAGDTLTVPASGVLGNDSDPEGKALTAALVATTPNGTLALNANGGFTYTPNAGFSGTDTFTYQAADPAGNRSPTATVSINVAAPTPPVVNLSANQSIFEGNSGTKTVTFTVTLSKAATSNVTVKYSTGNLSAVEPSDYTKKFGTLTFTPGQVSKTFSFQTKGDTAKESNELLKVVLYDIVGATEGDGYSTVTLKNDD